MSKLDIVVVGGGAAGLGLAARLARRYPKSKYAVTLVDRSQTHIWKPLLHEVAAGALDAGIDEINYRAHGKECGYAFVEGALRKVDDVAKVLTLSAITSDDGEIVVPELELAYDYLVLAIGSITNDFGTPGVREHCLMLDSREQADAFRRRFQLECLRVSRETVPGAGVRIVIVGGGATGVELAAELRNAADAYASYGMRNFNPRGVHVTLLEMGPRILPAVPEKLALQATQELRALGIDVRTGVTVTSAHADGFLTGEGDIIPADMQLWAAGVRGTADHLETAGLEPTARGQFEVGASLQVKGHGRIFAMGDCAFFVDEATNRPVPPRAQAAHQMAEVVFKNIRRQQEGGNLIAFHYRDYGTLVSLSRFAAVGTLMGSLTRGSLAITGRIARLAYAFLYREHIFGVLGWRKWLAWSLAGRANRAIRPRLKLH